MAMKKRKSKGNVTTVDFTGVQAGGLSVPDGRYAAKIIDAQELEGNDSGEPYVQLEWEITSQKCNGRTIKFDNHSLQPQALPFLRSVLEAIEYSIEDSGDTAIDWDEIIKDETECVIETVAAASQNDPSKKYARIVGFFPAAEGNTVDDEQDNPKAGKRTSRGATTTKDKDNDEETPKRRGQKAKDDDDDDDDDDETPKSGKKVKKGAKVKFKDDKNKLTRGTIERIDGDTAVVVSDDDDEYEIDIDELTVVG